MPEPLLTLDGVSKRFGATRAVSAVSLALHPGKIHALVGENGAGKSTIVRIIAGAVSPDTGTIMIGGKAVAFRTPADALRAGIGTSYQDRALLGMSVSDNIALGRETRRFGLISGAASRNLAKKYLAAVGLDIDPDRMVRDLSVHEQQLIAVAKALSVDARVLVFDEPTAALTLEETERLFDVLATLTRAGCAVVYVTHRLRELEEIADEATVLKDGKKVAKLEKADVREDVLVPLMLGRQIERLFPEPYRPDPEAAELLMVDEVSIDPTIEVAKEGVYGASLRVLRGEIVGLAGLEGSGRSSLAKAIAGFISPTQGRIRIERSAPSTRRMRRRYPRIGYIPPDRRAAGVFPELTVRSALTLAGLYRMVRFGLDRKKEQREAGRTIQILNIRPARGDALTRTLSGGNQQKTVLGRALIAEADVIVCEEPTAGVDVGARVDIYSAIVDLAKQGRGVVISSSDVLELMGLCHRIAVFRDGRIVRIYNGDEVTEEELVRAQFEGGPRLAAKPDATSRPGAKGDGSTPEGGEE